MFGKNKKNKQSDLVKNADGFYVKKPRATEEVKFAKTVVSDTTAISMDDIEKMSSRQLSAKSKINKAKTSTSEIDINLINSSNRGLFQTADLDTLLNKMQDNKESIVKNDYKMFSTIPIAKIHERLQTEQDRKKIKILKKVLKLKKKELK